MPADIADSILATGSKGQQWYKEFKVGCSADHNRFEKSITRKKVPFTCNAVIVRPQTKDRKIKNSRAQICLAVCFIYRRPERIMAQ